MWLDGHIVREQREEAAVSTRQSMTPDGIQSLVDPRGPAGILPASPAPRTPSLAGRRVLLIDNGKLDRSYGNYAVIYDCLRKAMPDAVWDFVAIDLLQNKEDDMPPLATRLVAEHKPDAAVLALADAGVTIVTAMLLVELERRGIPSALLATPLGSGLADVIFRAHMPTARSVTIDTVRTDSMMAVRKLMARHTDTIHATLTEVAAPFVHSGAELFRDDATERNWLGADEPMAAFQDFAERAGIGDGLPVLLPTQRAIELLLAAVPSDPDMVIYGPAVTSGRILRLRDAAANAAMTGCPPVAFPVVIAALRAMAQPEYRLFQGAITTHPGGNMIVLAGAEPARYGMSGGPGCLGPGHRGNASVGRAVSLSLQNLFGVRPGHGDLTAFGSPAEFTCCFAERVEDNPWPSLASELGRGEPGVFVLKAEITSERNGTSCDDTNSALRDLRLSSRKTGLQ